MSPNNFNFAILICLIVNEQFAIKKTIVINSFVTTRPIFLSWPNVQMHKLKQVNTQWFGAFTSVTRQSLASSFEKFSNSREAVAPVMTAIYISPRILRYTLKSFTLFVTAKANTKLNRNLKKLPVAVQDVAVQDLETTQNSWFQVVGLQRTANPTWPCTAN